MRQFLLGWIVGALVTIAVFNFPPSREVRLPHIFKPDTTYYYEIKIGDIWKLKNKTENDYYIQITEVTQDEIYYKWKFSSGLGMTEMNDDRDSFEQRYKFFRPAYIKKAKNN